MEISRRDALKLFIGGGVALGGVVRSGPAQSKTRQGARWGMVIDLRRCVGCQACTIACGMENETPVGHFRSTVSVSELEQAGRTRRLILPRTCNHCGDPACVKVCPTGATYQQGDGIVLVDNTVCIGCGYCAQACPYEARYINPVSHTADKCTFCVHRLEAGLLPACVETCVGGARIFGDLNNPDSQVSQQLEKNRARVLKPSSGTQPKVYYIGLPEDLPGGQTASSGQEVRYG